jgi:hypothetical protein
MTIGKAGMIERVTNATNRTDARNVKRKNERKRGRKNGIGASGL